MRIISVVVVIAAVLGMGGCGGQAKAPVAEKSAGPPAATAVDAKPASGGAFNVNSIFPPGDGRELVLSTCGTCHPVVCSTRGQKTAERWESIRKSHQDKLTSQPAADVTKMFAYLKQNFNETKPEPKIPAELAEQGCTPF